MINICVVTTTRAEYGLLSSVIKRILADEDCKLQLIVTGTHLSEDYGSTYREIEEEGIPIERKIPIVEGSTEEQILQTMANAITRVGLEISQLKPEIVILLGDRYEIHAIASACVSLRIPIAHISGGEISEGAFDEYYRHSITKLSFLHFTSTEEYRQRVIRMGEHPSRVFNVGDLGVENINNLKLFNKAELEKELGIPLSEKILQVTFHPVTLETDSARQFEELLLALEERQQYQVIITRPNVDTGAAELNDLIDYYVDRNKTRFFAFHSLGYRRFLSLLSYCSAIVGNSSSGIVEAPSLKIGSINIGNRQQGRACSESVLHVAAEKQAILDAIDYSDTQQYQEMVKSSVSPYESKGTSKKIIEIIKQSFETFSGIQKSFFEE